MSIKLFELAAQDQRIRFSPYCWRIKMALLHKGLEFESIPWQFADKSATAEAGLTKVPAIKDGDTWIGDSWEIAEYLDNQYPDAPKLISNTESRALAELVESICGTAIFPAVIPIAVYQVHNIIDKDSKTYFRQSRESMFGKTLEEINGDPSTSVTNLKEQLKPFEGMLQGNDFIGGSIPTYADYILFGVLKWADVVSTYNPIDAHTHVGKWFERLGSLYGEYATNAPGVRNI